MVVVKHKYIPGRNRGGNVVSIGKALAHVRYIQHRPGPDKERGGRELFDENGDRIDAKEMRKAIREAGNDRVVIHKLTLAPEINPQDKKAFTRDVMAKLGQDMGRDLRWFGVEHNNTDHHHIHVVVLGKDRNGTEVKIGLKDRESERARGEIPGKVAPAGA
jgi:type IV secretory pathway VirD2 relaxase